MSTNLHIPYHQELVESLTTGGDLFASMIRESVFQHKELPPPEIFAWYVRNSTYSFVAKRALHSVGKATDEELEMHKQEVTAIQILLETTKQLGLAHEVSEILRVSELSADA